VDAGAREATGGGEEALHFINFKNNYKYKLHETKKETKKIKRITHSCLAVVESVNEDHL
jgi:hypothetical protein